MIRPWLALPASFAHKLSPYYLKFAEKTNSFKVYKWHDFNWRGLQFNNPVGIAGGLDKDATNVNAWWNLGAGFIEVGTVTPKPQSPNPGKIIDRNVKNSALWNKMGFPSKGSDVVLQNLKSLAPYKTPLFVNIGKNRDTPQESAHKDYIYNIKKFKDVADAFVINISSPNTVGLRDLLKPINLTNFLEPIIATNKKEGNKPLL